MKLITAAIIVLLFISGCSKHPDVIKKPSGLEFANDSLGTGRAAKNGDLISIHFDAWIIKDSTNLFSDWTKDTTRIASSIGGSRLYGRPVKFVLGKNAFINGIDEGIEGMKTGGYRTIIVPAKLAYGDKGFGPIPPNSSLKFQVQLLEVKDAVVVKQWSVDSTKYKKTKDGLKYIIIDPGQGAKIDSGDVVTMHYSVFQLNGKKSDSSVERDEPLIFPYKLQKFIPGFTEGIGLLKKGGKAKLIVPPDLAYGSKGNGIIPPNSTLIFDIQILDVMKLPKQ